MEPNRIFIDALDPEPLLVARPDEAVGFEVGSVDNHLVFSVIPDIGRLVCRMFSAPFDEDPLALFFVAARLDQYPDDPLAAFDLPFFHRAQFFMNAPKQKKGRESGPSRRPKDAWIKNCPAPRGSHIRIYNVRAYPERTRLDLNPNTIPTNGSLVYEKIKELSLFIYVIQI